MIELINAISGVTFNTAWKNRIKGKYGIVDANYLSRSDLIRNKKAAGRPKDIADIDELKKK
jgi:hypothetical protein